MEKETVDLVMAKLDAVAIKIGTTAEQVWSWLIRQQYIDAFWCFGLLVFFSLGGYMSYRFNKEVEWEDWDYKITSKQVTGIVIAALSIIGIVGSFISFLTEFPDVFNAEYWALKDLLRMIR